MKSKSSVVQGLITLTLLIFIAEFGYAQGTGEAEWTLPSNEAIREMLAERMQHNGIGMVVGVIGPNGARVVAHGKIGATNGRPFDGDTIFQLGSLTKTFTTLLLADMVERGEVNLDDPASAYLPSGVGMPRLGRSITLRDLATHMSGLPSMPGNFDLHGKPDPYEAYSPVQLHEFLSSHNLEREPGMESSYSNLGVALLGRLLAGAKGMEYETLLKQRVLDPLGMTSTSITLSEDQLRRLAQGHDRYLQPVQTWEMATLPASGSLRSTANDMLILLAAHLGYADTPLKSAFAIQHIPQDNQTRALWGVNSRGIVGHSGGKQGYRSGIAFNPKTGIGAVVLANARTDDLPQNIALHLVTGEPIAPVPPAPADKPRIDVPHAILDIYTGSFQLRNGVVMEVVRNDSLLLVRYPGGGILEFFATGEHEFSYSGGNDDIKFEVDTEGQVTGFILYGDGKGAAGENINLAELISR